MKYILNKHRFDQLELSKDGFTYLQSAVQVGSVARVKRIVDAGIIIDVDNNDGMTTLMVDRTHRAKPLVQGEVPQLLPPKTVLHVYTFL